MRHALGRYIVLPAAALALVACGGTESKQPAAMDASLSRDLALAASQPYGPQQYVSPQELGYAQQYQPGYQPQYGAPQGYQVAQPVRQPTQVVYRDRPAATTRRTSSSSGTIYRAPSREPVIVQRNTKRDAVIGAAAGAVIGQAIGKDTKGTLIGAAAGAVLGGVIGHTVDEKRQ
jgi:uncharacterized protein YcfJ